MKDKKTDRHNGKESRPHPVFQRRLERSTKRGYRPIKGEISSKPPGHRDDQNNNR